MSLTLVSTTATTEKDTMCVLTCTSSVVARWMSAPAWTSRSTTSAWPFSLAKYTGLAPFCVWQQQKVVRVWNTNSMCLKVKAENAEDNTPGADPGGVRWARTNPPFYLFIRLTGSYCYSQRVWHSALACLLLIYSAYRFLLLLPACLTLSACVPVLSGYCIISVQSRALILRMVYWFDKVSNLFNISKGGAS